MNRDVKKTTLVTSVITITASHHDSRHFKETVKKANLAKGVEVLADGGYSRSPCEFILEAKGIVSQIQRKSYRNRRLTN